jgi:uncharacterized protein (TIGR03086 family)
MDSPDQARTAVAVLTPLVHATPASALTNPTPCDEWAVRDLLNHLVGGGYMFAAGLNGEELAGDPNADLIGEDHIAAYDGAIAAFSSALASASDLSEPVALPFATLPADMALRIAAADLLVHAWDLAIATGQPFDPPVEFVESVTPFYAEFISPPLRQGGLFGAEVDAGDDARPIDRLVALAGRQPC